MKYLLLIFILLLTTTIFSQEGVDSIPAHKIEKTHSPAIIIGYSYYNRHGAQLGFGKATYVNIRPHGYGYVRYASVEVSQYNKKNLWMPQIGIFGASQGSMGAVLVHYIHPEANSLKLRLEIGGGAYIFHAFYGRIFSITNKEFWPTSKNMFGIKMAFPTSKRFYGGGG